MIVIGADPFALSLKNELKTALDELGAEYIDVGGDEEKPYYEIAEEAAKKIQAGDAEKGILLCGTGAGMAVVANKFSGITAVVSESVYSAELARAINNANVLTMGAMLVAPWKAKKMMNVFLSTEHASGDVAPFAEFLCTACEEVAAIDQRERGQQV
jgi:ribose 5-phosphate isomerase B